MYVNEIIETADSWVANTLSTEEKVTVINQVEKKIYANMVKSYKNDTISTVAEQYLYDLSLKEYTVESISKVVIDNAYYDYSTLRDNMLYSYWEEDGKLAISPTPTLSVTDAIEITYKHTPGTKTADGMEIETLDIVQEFGTHFSDIYLWALLNRYCLKNQEFDLANNYALLYNDTEAGLYEYITRHRPSMVAYGRKKPNTWR